MKKGFTLIEVMAVVALIGIIALITYPAIDKTIKDSREKAYATNIGTIEHAAYLYSSADKLGYSTTYQALPIQTLKDAGLLEDSDIKNPINNTTIGGCVMYKWIEAKKQYTFKYSSDCTDPQ